MFRTLWDFLKCLYLTVGEFDLITIFSESVIIFFVKN